MDVAIVGAGIVGLAHAWCAAERGHRVRVFERSRRACGASVRNFGMVWLIGQPPGEALALGFRSRERWLRLAAESGIWVNPCGSMLLAHRDDEAQVLCEFAERAPELGYECRWVGPAEIALRSPAVNRDGLRGGLLSATELGLNPPRAIRTLPLWLAKRFGVDFEFGTTISSVEDRRVRSSDDREWSFDRLVICGGADMETLFPEQLAASGARLCKLQMLRTRPQAPGWRIGPHLASGLSLRHYRSFEGCQGLPALKSRVALESPELDRFGIHVMASQDDEGRVILGDSHEHDVEIDPFDKAEIDELILRELRKIIDLPDWSIDARWHGVYARLSEGTMIEAEPLPWVFLRTGTGGNGMTLAFGLAERDWQRWG
ncbi:MAG: TIGR03364 family FAD-dependent oxidoreductase [Isosphaeraceae bacterium]